MSRWRLALLLVAAATSARAQRVQLELRPQRGDTLHMRLDQAVDVTGSRRGSPSHQTHTAVSMFSRAIVERSSANGTLILAVMDSVGVASSDEHAQALGADAQRQLQGQRVRMWLGPDGTVQLLDPSRNVPHEVNDLASIMPGSFPTEAVAVGDTWVRVMPIPPAARMGLPLGGVVRASFRLDSVSRSGDLAYLSMRGNVRQESQSGEDDPALLAGSLSGSMIMDRHRGWLSESRFLIEVRASVKPTRGRAVTPMSFTTKITQHMVVTDGRQ